MERKIDELVKSYREDMIQSLEELVSIPSVINLENAREGAPFGMEIRSALDGLLKLAGELGFETRDYDGYAAAVDFGTEGKEVGILSHIDVVPPGNGWSKNPFVPEIVNGKMYGRGTIDDKGPLVASLYAMKAVKESGLPIRNHVRHIIGCDEETGHRCIKYYLTKEKGPDLGFSPDGMFSVIHAEKGILRFQIQTNRKLPDTKELCVIRIAGGTVVNAVPNIAEVWLGGPGEQLEESVHLTRPDTPVLTESLQIRRPELALYNARQYQLNVREQALKAGIRPQLSLFAQGAYGNPGLNMLKDAFEPSYLVGARLSWNFGSLYTLRNDRRQLDNERLKIESNRNLFLFNTRMQLTQQDETVRTLREQMKKDDEIIRLRTHIRQAAESKVANGTLSVTEMLRELTRENLARQDKALHEIQLLLTYYQLQHLTNE